MKITYYPRYFIRRFSVKGKDGFYSAGYKCLYPECTRHGMTPWQHYVIDGFRKGYDDGNHPPADVFFPEGYAFEYPDVSASGEDAWHHYAENGSAEGRDDGLHPDAGMFFPEGYLEMYPDAAGSGLDPWHHYVLVGTKEGRDCGLHPKEDMFFAEGYAAMYPDIAEAGLDPWHHYVLAGKKEGRDNGLHPGEELFFADGYLEMYPDVAKAGQDPWRHYLLAGKKEGRDNGEHPGEDIFSAEGYLKKYPDVKEAHLDPWHHYVTSGKKEGRGTGKSKVIDWPSAQHLFSRNVLVIADPSMQQHALFRADQKKSALENYGYKVSVISIADRTACMSLLQSCSAAVFYHVSYADQAVEYYKEARRLGVRIIYDSDDLLFSEEAVSAMAENSSLSAEQKALVSEKAKSYREAMLQADENWFSTKALCDLADREYGIKGIFVPDCIPEELSRTAAEFPGERRENRTIKILCACAFTHVRVPAQVHDALETVLAGKEHVQLVLLGDAEFDCSKQEIKRKIRKIGMTEPEDYYYPVSQCDIAVLPTESDVFSRAGSCIKYIEASVYSIPAVCSDAYELPSAARNGVNCFIARNRDEWINALQLLIDDRERRIAVGKAARDTVLQLYSPKMTGEQLASLLEPYSAEKGRKESVLIANVLYGVSSFGGATVVAERLAEEIQANSDYEVNVFSAYTDLHEDEDAVKRYSWNGVQVWAVNVYDISLDYINTRLKDVFAEVLDLVTPKLVHFHCVQTLGMDMCLECSERKVPYFVTIHDGWWNCVRQFMVDNSGNYCGDEVSSCALCKARCGISGADFYRKRHLAHLVLRNAEKVYTPSHYFSALIQRNFPSVPIYTNKNGIIQNDKTAACRETEAENERERIVLGFFGGRELVKGYFLLRECLDSLGREADNFRLVLIDTARRGGSDGSMMNEVWPLDVEIHGYTPHEKMYEMYQKIDVLLFPSMWKESFGLMVREAIYNDVFVVCSDCGGPSEAIVNNENGLIFPMGDKDKFRKCLQFLIKNKDFIKHYKTKNFGDVRTFKEQALELLKDFDQVRPCEKPVSSEA